MIINRRKQRVGGCHRLKLFISLALLPAICTVAAAETPDHSFGVATASHPSSASSSLWRAEDDKSYNYNRLLQEVELQTTTATVEVDEDHDDHDHDEEGHDDHKDELVVVSYEMNTDPAMSSYPINLCHCALSKLIYYVSSFM